MLVLWQAPVRAFFPFCLTLATRCATGGLSGLVVNELIIAFNVPEALAHATLQNLTTSNVSTRAASTAWT